ncbi:DUF4249 domain-containing protein [Mucilaginibacter litoreus]|uniref:DUF4249 domain-containing protein n=1 Tax=Mucilaginibacter litoreus TaxID=1048221 RepID=A0ABW3AVS3_9SPHI
MIKKFSQIGLLMMCVLYVSCRKSFDPTVQTQAKSYLVVEGLINTGNDSTIIKLSRTVNVNDTMQVKTEAGATINVIDETGNTYRLVEVSAGRYGAGPLGLNALHKYGLDIVTGNGTHYQSDLEAVRNAPPIDSVGYNVKDNRIIINVSSHDPANNTHYYKWDYDEDWQFNSKYRSGYIAEDDSVRRRTLDEDIYYCFNKSKSNNIVLGSSVKLTSDLIHEAPVISIPGESLKISLRYSILVKEFALSKEAYLFYENLKKNTEQLGSIFDALPSEISGNIHNVDDPKELVIGYILAGTYTQKRKYINKSELPNWQTAYPEGCQLDTALYKPLNNDPLPQVQFWIVEKRALATDSIASSTGEVLGFFRTGFVCADCTLTGTKKRPDFWEDN